MIWIYGIWITRPSDNSISLPNKENKPITNMQIVIGSISRVQSITNYEGVKWISDMVMEMPPPTPRKSAGDESLDFLLSGGPGAAGSALSQSRKGLSPSPPPR